MSVSFYLFNLLEQLDVELGDGVGLGQGDVLAAQKAGLAIEAIDCVERAQEGERRLDTHVCLLRLDLDKVLEDDALGVCTRCIDGEQCVHLQCLTFVALVGRDELAKLGHEIGLAQLEQEQLVLRAQQRLLVLDILELEVTTERGNIVPLLTSEIASELQTPDTNYFPP